MCPTVVTAECTTAPCNILWQLVFMPHSHELQLENYKRAKCNLLQLSIKLYPARVAHATQLSQG